MPRVHKRIGRREYDRREVTRVGANAKRGNEAEKRLTERRRSITAIVMESGNDDQRNRRQLEE